MRTNNETRAKKWETYNEMMQAIPHYVQMLTERFNTISEPFLWIADEAERVYFLDMEYKDEKGDYRRFYGNISQAALDKKGE